MDEDEEMVYETTEATASELVGKVISASKTILYNEEEAGREERHEEAPADVDARNDESPEDEDEQMARDEVEEFVEESVPDVESATGERETVFEAPGVAEPPPPRRKLSKEVKLKKLKILEKDEKIYGRREHDKSPKKDLSEGPRRFKKPITDNPNGPFHARPWNELKILEKLKTQGPIRHEYFGYIFSAQSQRPPLFYRQYMLPVYNQPQPRQHISITGSIIPASKLQRNDALLNYMTPLSAVKIRWKSNRLATIYKLEDIYAYLTTFGPIDGVYPLSVNSAMVIFTDIEAAREAVMCPCLGYPWDRLIATWLEPRMYNYGFYCKYLAIEAPRLRFRVDDM